MKKFRVAEKFVSINGEGTKAGELAVFIRFCGCNLSCSYCDTQWANAPDVSYSEEDVEEIFQYVQAAGVKNITLTGGEPLLIDNIEYLIERLLADSKFSVEIETNGSVLLEKFCQLEKRPIFTMDYKLPSSGMEEYMCLENMKLLQKQDTIKFVIGTIEDLEKSKFIIDKYDLSSRCHVYLSPVYGSIEPDKIVEFMKDKNMNNVRLQLQLHKYIWNPQERGV